MTEYVYRVIYERDEDGGYQVILPAMPEIITYGRTLEEAREMAQDALTCHIQGLKQDGEQVPRDRYVNQKPVIEELKVAV